MVTPWTGEPNSPSGWVGMLFFFFFFGEQRQSLQQFGPKGTAKKKYPKT